MFELEIRLLPKDYDDYKDRITVVYSSAVNIMLASCTYVELLS